MSDEQALKIASLDAELRDRINENREVRRGAGRALRFIEAGDIESAKTPAAFPPPDRDVRSVSMTLLEIDLRVLAPGLGSALAVRADITRIP
ncbi:hypothetical protein [Streptomyces noursei]|uniref:hypothetical protein n=1 Tax=Streptomyces noursei TaxID=1971 RepID=UPI00167B4287|nr:hypothetical protein [Streptomyces noursei]MCZ1013921.1 hypothetical protein [Streptomyces noursei]GGX40860.1 hypothetical protein GCM10010341_73540 [Streptomyces noursei]